MMCIVIMLMFAKMSAALGAQTISVLVIFYRISILLSILLMLAGVKNRAHFILYETSYYAIALILYYCIVFTGFFMKGGSFHCWILFLFL